MSDLKPCPCGKTPTLVFTHGGGDSKWAWVTGDCCGEWSIEFRTKYLNLGTPESNELAIDAWDAAPRGG